VAFKGDYVFFVAASAFAVDWDFEFACFAVVNSCFFEFVWTEAFAESWFAALSCYGCFDVVHYWCTPL